MAPGIVLWCSVSLSEQPVRDVDAMQRHGDDDLLCDEAAAVVKGEDQLRPLTGIFAEP